MHHLILFQNKKTRFDDIPSKRILLKIHHFLIEVFFDAVITGGYQPFFISQTLPIVNGAYFKRVNINNFVIAVIYFLSNLKTQRRYILTVL